MNLGSSTTGYYSATGYTTIAVMDKKPNILLSKIIQFL